jgi:hypothetical protein
MRDVHREHTSTHWQADAVVTTWGLPGKPAHASPTLTYLSNLRRTRCPLDFPLGSGYERRHSTITRDWRHVPKSTGVSKKIHYSNCLARPLLIRSHATSSANMRSGFGRVVFHASS